LAWLATVWHTPRPDAAAAEPVQLMVLPSAIPQKIRADNVRVRRLEAGSPLSAALPLLDGNSFPPETPSPAGTRGGGSGVDWAAEARRALQAFEIRSHQPAGNTSVSRSSAAEQPWWPAHRPGERVKTADGNWIVWIDSSCYQIASSSASPSGTGPAPSTICPKEPPRTGSPDPAH
jgi:hypothetical protein